MRTQSLWPTASPAWRPATTAACPLASRHPRSSTCARAKQVRPQRSFLGTQSHAHMLPSDCSHVWFLHVGRRAVPSLFHDLGVVQSERQVHGRAKA